MDQNTKGSRQYSLFSPSENGHPDHGHRRTRNVSASSSISLKPSTGSVHSSLHSDSSTSTTKLAHTTSSGSSLGPDSLLNGNMEDISRTPTVGCQQLASSDEGFPLSSGYGGHRPQMGGPEHSKRDILGGAFGFNGLESSSMNMRSGDEPFSEQSNLLRSVGKPGADIVNGGRMSYQSSASPSSYRVKTTPNYREDSGGSSNRARSRRELPTEFRQQASPSRQTFYNPVSQFEATRRRVVDLPERAPSVVSNYLPSNYDPELVNKPNRTHQQGGGHRSTYSSSIAGSAIGSVYGHGYGNGGDERSETGSVMSQASRFRTSYQQPSHSSGLSDMPRSQSMYLSGQHARRTASSSYDLEYGQQQHHHQNILRHSNGSSMSTARNETGNSAGIGTLNRSSHSHLGRSNGFDGLKRSQSVYGDPSGWEGASNATDSTRSRHASLTPSKSITGNITSLLNSRVPGAVGTTEEQRAESRRRRAELLVHNSGSVDVSPARGNTAAGGLKDRFLFSEPRPSSSANTIGIEKYLPNGGNPTLSTSGGLPWARDHYQQQPKTAPAQVRLHRQSLILNRQSSDAFPESPLARQRASSRISLVSPASLTRVRGDGAYSPVGSTITINDGTPSRVTMNRLLASLRQASSKGSQSMIQAAMSFLEALPTDQDSPALRANAQQTATKADRLQSRLGALKDLVTHTSVEIEVSHPEEAQAAAIASCEEMMVILREALRESDEQIAGMTEFFSALLGLVQGQGDNETSSQREPSSSQGAEDLARRLGCLKIGSIAQYTAVNANNGSTSSREGIFTPERSQKRMPLDDASSSSGGSSVATQNRRSSGFGGANGQITPGRSFISQNRRSPLKSTTTLPLPEHEVTLHEQQHQGSNIAHNGPHHAEEAQSPQPCTQTIQRRRSNASTIGPASSNGFFLGISSTGGPTTAVSQVHASVMEGSPTEEEFDSQAHRSSPPRPRQTQERQQEQHMRPTTGTSIDPEVELRLSQSGGHQTTSETNDKNSTEKNKTPRRFSGSSMIRAAYDSLSSVGKTAR